MEKPTIEGVRGAARGLPERRKGKGVPWDPPSIREGEGRRVTPSPAPSAAFSQSDFQERERGGLVGPLPPPLGRGTGVVGITPFLLLVRFRWGSHNTLAVALLAPRYDKDTAGIRRLARQGGRQCGQHDRGEQPMRRRNQW